MYIGKIKLKIITISAHPDDLEIACSGTLKKFHDQGAEIISIVTVAPSAEDNSQRSKEIVESELSNSYNLSKFNLRVFNTPLHANGRPNLTVDNNTMHEISKLCENCDIAIIPHIDDYHQDHRNTHSLVFPLMLKFAKEIWAAHSVPYCHYYKSNPTMYVDISARWEFKKSLIKCYSSYFTNTMIDRVESSNRYWAQPLNTDLAEAFTLLHKHG